MARRVGLPPPAGMDELTDFGDDFFRLTNHANGGEVAVLVGQRSLDTAYFSEPGARVTKRKQKRKFAEVAGRAGIAPTIDNVLDLTAVLRPGRYNNQRLVCTLPELSTPERNGSVPHPPPDIKCEHALYKVLSECMEEAPKGRPLACVAHCNHGCNRTGLLMVSVAMVMSGKWKLSHLEELIREFARCRRALPGNADVGIYDMEVFWVLYTRFFFMPPVRPLPPRVTGECPVDDEGNVRSVLLAVLPPRRIPAARGGMAGFMDSSEHAKVPRPQSSVTCILCIQSGPKATPIKYIGTRGETITYGIERTDVLNDVRTLIRAGTRTTTNNSEFKKMASSFAMPHEVVDAHTITDEHMVGGKADGVRAMLVFTTYGAFIVVRTEVVQGINVSRPPGCLEAVLDGELVMPTRSNPNSKVLYYAFDLLLVRSVGEKGEVQGGTGSLGDKPFSVRLEKLTTFVKTLDETVKEMCRAHPPEALRRWSKHSPAPEMLQSVTIAVKPFFCICHAPLIMAMTMKSCCKSRQPPRTASLVGTCGLCRSVPPLPTEEEMGIMLRRYGEGWTTDMDGLVFYRNTMVHGGKHILPKCKPGALQTVEFEWESEKFYYMSNGKRTQLKGMRVNGLPRLEADAEDYPEVVELRLLSIPGVSLGDADAMDRAIAKMLAGEEVVTIWEFVCKRFDKFVGNSLEVLLNTLRAVAAGVWERSLIPHIADICGLEVN